MSASTRSSLSKSLPLDTLVHSNDRKIGGRNIAVSWRFARKRCGQILGFDAMSVDCVVSEDAGLTRSNGHKDPGEIIFLVFLRRAFQIVVDTVRSTRKSRSIVSGGIERLNINGEICVLGSGATPNDLPVALHRHFQGVRRLGGSVDEREEGSSIVPAQARYAHSPRWSPERMLIGNVGHKCRFVNPQQRPQRIVSALSHGPWCAAPCALF